MKSMPIYAVLALVAGLWCSVPAAWSQPPTSRPSHKADAPALPDRKLRLIPLQQWHRIVRQNPESEIIRYRALLKLWRRAHQGKRSLETSGRKPILRRLSLKGHVQGLYARLHVRIALRTFQRGWQKIPLSLAHLSLKRTRLKGLRGLVSFARGAYTLYIFGAGEGTLSLEGSSRITKESRGYRLKLGLPSTPSSSLLLTFPQKQEVYENPNKLLVGFKASQTRVFGSLSGASALSLAYRPFEKTTQHRAFHATHSRLRVRIEKNIQWLHAAITFRLHLGSRTRFQVQLPSGFVLTKVKAPNLAEFRLDKAKARLHFRLQRPPQQQAFTLQLRMFRNQSSNKLTLAPLKIPDAYEETGQIAIWHDPLLTLRVKPSAQTQRIPVPSHRWEKQRAALAYRFWSPRASFVASVSPIQPRFSVKQELKLQLRQREAKLLATLKLQMRAGQLYQFRVKLPTGWGLQSFQEQQGGALRTWQEGSTLRVTLSKKLVRNQTRTFLLRLARRSQLPAQGSMSLALPSLYPLGATRYTGSLQIQVNPFYTLKTQALQSLETMRSQSHTLRILQAPYQGTLTLQRKPPAVHLVTVGRYRVERASLRAQIDAHLRVSGSGIRHLSLRLPEAIGTSISFRGIRANIIQKKPSTPQKGWRLWRLQFDREQFGRFAVLIRFQVPIPPQSKSIPIPMLSGHKVSFETGYVAIEAHANTELDATPRALREVDSSQIPRPLGKRVALPTTFAYQYFNPQRALSLRFLRYQPHPILQAAVELLVMTAEVSPSGRTRLSATFSLYDQSIPTFEAKLPPKAVFWSAQLNGKGVKPIFAKDRVKLALPPQQSQTPRTIRLIYEHQGTPLRSRQQLISHAPQVPYPIRKTQWTLYLPKDYFVTGISSKHDFRIRRFVPPPMLLSLLRAAERSGQAAFVVFLLLLFLLRFQIWRALRWLVTTAIRRWKLALSLTLFFAFIGFVVGSNFFIRKSKTAATYKTQSYYDAPTTTGARQLSAPKKAASRAPAANNADDLDKLASPKESPKPAPDPAVPQAPPAIQEQARRKPSLMGKLEPQKPTDLQPRPENLKQRLQRPTRPKRKRRKGKGRPTNAPAKNALVVVTKKRIQIMQKVFFGKNSSRPRRRSYPILNQIARVLRANPHLRVRVEGHTDNRGTTAYNIMVSKRRARTVRRYLLRRGVSPRQLVTRGFGPLRPIRSNKTGAGRTYNNRVEFRILSRASRDGDDLLTKSGEKEKQDAKDGLAFVPQQQAARQQQGQSRVVIRTQPGNKVTLDGRVLGYGNQRLRTKPGTYTITISKPGHSTVKRTIVVKANRNTKLSIKTPPHTKRPQDKGPRWQEGRFARGVRSMKLPHAATGFALLSQGLGANPSVSVQLVHRSSLRFVLIGAFFLGLLLLLLASRAFPARKLLLFAVGLLSLSLLSLSSMAHIAMFINAITLGWIVAGIGQYALRKPKTSATSASMVLLLLSSSLFAPHAQATPPPHNKAFSSTPPVARQQPSVAPQRPPTRPPALSPRLIPPLYAPYYPKDGLPVIGPSTRVLLPKAWLQSLRQLADPTRFPPRAPRNIQLLEAQYKGEILEKTVSFQATLRVQVLSPGAQLFPLDLRNARISKATLAGKAHPLMHDGIAYAVVLAGHQTHTLHLTFTIARKPSQNHLDLFLPPASSASLQLSLAQPSWRFQCSGSRGGSYTQRSKTHSRLHATIGMARKLQLRWLPRLPQGGDASETMSVKTHTHAHVLEHLVRLRSRFFYSRNRGKTDRFAWFVPATLQVEHLRGPNVRAWSIEKNKGKRILLLRLEAPVKQVRLDIHTSMRRQSPTQAFTLPRLQPLAVIRQTGIIGISAAKTLRLNEAKLQNVEKESNETFPSQTHFANTPPLYQVYSYTLPPSLRFSVRAHKPKPRFSLRHRLHLKHHLLQLQSSIEAAFAGHSLFHFTFRISKDLQILQIRSTSGPKVKEFWIAGAHRGARLLHIALEQHAQDKHAFSISAYAKSDKQGAVIPLLTPHHAQQVNGEIGVFVAKEYNVALRNDTGLEATSIYRLSPWTRRVPAGEVRLALGYHFQQSTYKGSLRTVRPRINVTARLSLHLAMQSDSFLLRGRLRYLASGAGTRRFAFSLPKELAAKLELNQRQFRDIQFQPTSAKRTLVLLSTRTLHQSLDCQFQLRIRIPKSGRVFAPLIRPEQVARARTQISLSKTSQLRIDLEKAKHHNLRTANTSSLSLLPATIKTQNIFAAYRTRRQTWSLDFLREELRTDAGVKPIVDIVHLESVLSRHGEIWTRATYTLRTPGLQFLRMRMPPQSALWSVSVNTKTIRPSIHKGAKHTTLLIPLPPKHASDIAYNVRVLYKEKASALSATEPIVPHAPQLQKLSISETFWTLYIPHSRRLLWDNGNMIPSTPSVLAAARLEKAVNVFQRLATISQSGNKADQTRAQDNLNVQIKKVQRYLQSARSSFQRDQWSARKGSFNKAQSNELNRNRGRLRNLEQTVRILKRQNEYIQKKRRHTSYKRKGRSKHVEGVLLKDPQHRRRPRTSQGRDTRALALPWRLEGRPLYFSLIGGSPQLQMRFYHRNTPKELFRWGAIGLLLLFLLLAWWRGWLSPPKP